MNRVLVIEDDAPTAHEIAAALRLHGCAVDCAGTARDGLRQATEGKFDAIVLDRMLPGGADGLQVLQTLRSVGVGAPVLILSALSAVDERVRGLRAGGDDYLTKPFACLELTARLDVLIRRSEAPAPATILTVGDLTLDPRTRAVRRGGAAVQLLPREYMLLEHLMRHAEHVMTRPMLFEAVWDYRFDRPGSLIDVHVGNLRRKLDAGGRVGMIHTVRGQGYVLRAPPCD